MCCAMCTHGINLGVKKRNQPGWIVAPNVITVLTATSGPPVRCGAVRCGRRRSSDLDGHHNQTGHPPSRPPRWRPRARPRPTGRPRLKAPATRARGRVGLLAVPAAGWRGGLWSGLPTVRRGSGNKVSGSPQRARRAYSEVDAGGLDLDQLVSALIYRLQDLKLPLRNS